MWLEKYWRINNNKPFILQYNTYKKKLEMCLLKGKSPICCFFLFFFGLQDCFKNCQNICK